MSARRQRGRREPAATPVSRKVLENVAAILGQQSAAAECLAEADRFLAGAFDRRVAFYRVNGYRVNGGSWLVAKFDGRPENTVEALLHE